MAELFDLEKQTAEWNAAGLEVWQAHSKPTANSRGVEQRCLLAYRGGVDGVLVHKLDYTNPARVRVLPC